MSKPVTPAHPKTGSGESSAEVDFEQQLQLFWKNNRGIVLGFVGLVFLIILGRFGWDAHLTGQEADVQQAFAMAETDAQLRAFVADHPGHVLSGVAQLRLADEAYAAGNFNDAAVAYAAVSSTPLEAPLSDRARLGKAMADIGAGRADAGASALEGLANDTGVLEAIRAESLYQLLSLAHSQGRTQDVASYSSRLLQLAPLSAWTQRALSLQAAMPATTLDSSLTTGAELPGIQFNLPVE